MAFARPATKRTLTEPGLMITYSRCRRARAHAQGPPCPNSSPHQQEQRCPQKEPAPPDITGQKERRDHKLRLAPDREQHA